MLAIVHNVDKHSWYNHKIGIWILEESTINKDSSKTGNPEDSAKNLLHLEDSTKTLKCKNIHQQQATNIDSSEITKYIYIYLLCSNHIQVTLRQVHKYLSNRRVVDPLLHWNAKSIARMLRSAKAASEYSFTSFQGEDTHTKPVYLRSSCCFANGTLTVWWFLWWSYF